MPSLKTVKINNQLNINHLIKNQNNEKVIYFFTMLFAVTMISCSKEKKEEDFGPNGYIEYTEPQSDLAKDFYQHDIKVEVFNADENLISSEVIHFDYAVATRDAYGLWEALRMDSMKADLQMDNGKDLFFTYDRYYGDFTYKNGCWVSKLSRKRKVQLTILK